MTPQDKDIIQQWARNQANTTAITLVKAKADATSRLAHFAGQLESLVPGLTIKAESEDSRTGSTTILVGQHQNIAFQAVPTGKILKAFLEALQAHPSETHQMSDRIIERIQQIDLPTLFKLYITPQCPHCPKTLAQMLPLAKQNQFIRLTIIDAEMFNDAAQKDQIKSVPTLLLDDHLRWGGQLDLDELLTVSLKRDPALLSAATLRQLIEEGQAERVALMMMRSGRVFQSLVELIVHDRWSVRLGAMVTAEYLAEQSPQLSRRLSDMLWSRLPELQDQTQGDVVHVLGELMSDENLTRLQQIVGGDFSQAAKEAAAEVLSDLSD